MPISDSDGVIGVDELYEYVHQAVRLCEHRLKFR